MVFLQQRHRLYYTAGNLYTSDICRVTGVRNQSDIARIQQEGSEDLKALQTEIQDLKVLVAGMDKGIGYVIEQSGEEDNGKKGEQVVALIDPTTGKTTKTIKIKMPDGREVTGQSVETKTGE